LPPWKLACQKEAARAARMGVAPLFTEEALLRKFEEPDLEALEKLPDEQLVLFGIKRQTVEKFSVKPLEIKADKLSRAARATAEKPELN
jgi:hypothetical protein